MNSSPQAQPRVRDTVRQWWRDAASRVGGPAATRALLKTLWEFLCESTPARLRQRYGDADYDWEHRVNTTSGAVSWRDRLLGMFHSEYQPTEPALFHEMIAALAQKPGVDFADFTFIDLGSGKGRTLLMASDYPFRRIVGVELIPALHQVAQQNLSQYKSELQKCFALEAICGDASGFPLPDEPLLIYLFNPLQESVLRQVLAHLEHSLRDHPRPAYVLYHNPLMEHVLGDCAPLAKIAGTHQYSLWGNDQGKRTNLGF